jgi:hypothetical protein
MITSESVKRALAVIKRGADYKFFFDNLHSPDWIGPLEEAGLFASPPLPIKEGEYIRFPDWPASQFLVRMAPKEPQKVCALIERVPQTENPRVNEDFARAALAMPPKLSASLVGYAQRWLENRHQLFLPQKLAKLVVHLAKGRQSEAAFELARVLLEVLPDPNPPQDSWDHPEPQSRLKRDWDYQEVVKQIREPLMQNNPDLTLSLFAGTLSEALRLSQRPGNKESYDDGSTIWFEDIDRNDIGFKDVLVSVVRDIAQEMASSSPENLEQVVLKLEERRWTVFRRIALYLLRKSAYISAQLIGDRLSNRELFDVEWREYKLLAQERFSTISKRQQDLFLEWVDAGPSEKYLSYFPVDQQDKTNKYWQAERLNWIQKFLSPERQQRLKALIADTRTPETPDAPMMVSWTGPTSPKSSEELKAMSPGEVAEFLRSWRPSERDMDHSRIGLGRTVTPIVAENPNAFASILSQIHDLDPTYVRAFIEGFESAVKSKKSFDWKPALNLCEWVMMQEREIPGRTVSEGFLKDDRDWGWTRKAIANLIETGCREQKVGIPFELRDTVKNLLVRLVEDKEPVPEDELGEGKMEPFNASVNFTRPVSMHALIHYGLWVHRWLEDQGIPNDVLKIKGFEEMPEMRRILEDHLNPMKDPSSAVRSVYGQWFPWIALLDPTWAKKYAHQIFRKTNPEDRLPLIAWNTYLRANQAYNEVYDILADRYHEAVSELDAKKHGNPTDEQEQLAQHLMALAWRGKILMNEEGGIWQYFWKKASPTLRSKAIEWIGRSFYQTKGDVPPDFKERARAIWEQRLAYAREHAEEVKSNNELNGFGWWFASAQFSLDWALPQMREVLNYSNKFDADYFVMKRLAPIAKDWPLESIQVMTGLVNLDREGWGVSGWTNEARQVIEAARDSGNTRARDLAIDLIHRLGAFGHLEFRDLLPNAVGH